MSLEVSDIVIRLALAFGAGFVLGLERESHGRAAGLRTVLLVSTAAATAMILSEVFYEASAEPGAAWRPDPARLAAGILTGMGFLGGGVIIRQGNLIRGVTTAAVLWFVTIMGLSFGGGQYLLGGLAFAIGLFTLFVVPYLEGIVKNDWYATVTLTASAEGATVAEMREAIKSMNIRVKNVELSQDTLQGIRTVTLYLKFKKQKLTELPEQVINRLLQCPGIQQANWK
jgi:putative Mg2+ transporter-C (MgtC) family protein